MASSESSMKAHLQLYEIFLSSAKPMALQAAVLLNIPNIIATHGSENHMTVEEIASHISASTNKPAHRSNLSRIIFEYASHNPETSRLLNEAMTVQTSSLMASVLKVYDGFNIFKSVVDVGGGLGSAISTIVYQYPHINGINFDLPHVIAMASPIKGVEHMEGNMFEKIPSTDAVLMKRVLHDWDDQFCLKLLTKSYEAVPVNGKVLIVDQVIQNKGIKRQLGLLFNVVMMALSVGGKERTEDEFKDLLYKAGFKSYRIIELPFFQSFIEVCK